MLRGVQRVLQQPPQMHTQVRSIQQYVPQHWQTSCCCSKIAEGEATVSVNEKKWLVKHMHVQLKLDELNSMLLCINCNENRSLLASQAQCVLSMQSMVADVSMQSMVADVSMQSMVADVSMQSMVADVSMQSMVADVSASSQPSLDRVLSLSVSFFGMDWPIYAVSASVCDSTISLPCLRRHRAAGHLKSHDLTSLLEPHLTDSWVLCCCCQALLGSPAPPM
jgi:hypothetical protein